LDHTSFDLADQWRLMGAFQDRMLALDRIRRGGRQVVTVQHVTVGTWTR